MRHELDLGGEWELLHTLPGCGEKSRLFSPRAPRAPRTRRARWSGAIRARVPGMVNLDLLDARILPDPYRGRNAEQWKWVGEHDWWYRRFFEIEGPPGERTVLLFEGLDTFATVFLDGQEIARHEDMFMPLEIDLTGRVRSGERHCLVVKLAAPKYESFKRAGDPRPLWNASYERLYVRKAQMSYGWDWAQEIPVAGIYRPVKLLGFTRARIEDVRVRAAPGEEGATVEVTAEVNSFARNEVRVNFEFEAECEGSKVDFLERVVLAPGRNKLSTALLIPGARLWWPNGQGEQAVYRGRASVSDQDSEIDSVPVSFGIRSVELVLEGDETPNGKVFYFRVNGRKVFAQGANWVPLDLFFPRACERYDRALAMASMAGMNMLRVWGGGIVEHERFYDLCDELGIMLWHDFPFACGDYPQDEEFLEKCAQEAESIVKRLRNRPSVVLWCGNNENEQMMEGAGLKDVKQPLFYETLRGVCEAFDPERPYWPSSATGGERANDPTEGDRHSWDWWFGFRSHERIEDEARFSSEFGAQAAPDEETLAYFLPPEELWEPGGLWQYHMAQMQRLCYYVRDYAVPRSLRDFVRGTQEFQATVVGRMVEHYRRRAFACGGATVWSFGDPWPNVSWSVVDYFLRPKAAYYRLRRAFAPVAVSLEPVEPFRKYAAWVANDSQEKVSGTLSLVHARYGGEEVASKEGRFELERGERAKVVEYELPDPSCGREEYLVCRTDLPDVFEAREPMSVPREMVLPKANLRARHDGEGIEVRSDKYARTVELRSAAGEPLVFSDNFFDLSRDEARRVKLLLHEGAPPELVVRARNAPEVPVER